MRPIAVNALGKEKTKKLGIKSKQFCAGLDNEYLIKSGLTQNTSQTLFSSLSSLLRGSLFRDLCVSPKN